MAPQIYISDRAWEKASKVLDAIGTKYRICETQKQPSLKSRHSYNPNDEIILPGRAHGNYSYPDIIVPLHRLGLSQQVVRAGKQLTLSLENTAQEQDGTRYIGRLTSGEASDLAFKLDYELTIRQFADFLNELRKGIDGEKVYNGRGKPADRDRLRTAYNEITEVREPWRAEHFDAKFGDKTITYHLIETDGTREVTEPLSDALMEDRTPGIDLDSWLKTADEHGLPTSKTENGKLYYLYPRNGAVAWFNAGSDGAGLICDGVPDIRCGRLGVRVVRKKI